MNRAVRLSVSLGVPSLMTSYPAPAVGGVVIHFRLLEAILNGPSHGDGVEKQVFIDMLNRMVGAASEKVHVEVRHLVNTA